MMQPNEKGTQKDLVLYRIETSKSDIKAAEILLAAKELVSRVEEYVQARWKKESEKTVRNAEYLDMIDRGINQLSAGNGQEHELNETD